MNDLPPNTRRWVDLKGPGAGRPDHPILNHTVHDVLDLGDPPQRRFHMAMMDNGDRRLVVLNSLRDELIDNVRGSERRRMTLTLQRGNLDWDQQRRVVSAAVQAAERWILDELNSPDSMFFVPKLTAVEKRRTEELLLVLPYEFFSGKISNMEADRAIVAEAVACGKRLVISEDKGSIRQAQLNRWLHEAGFTSIEDGIRPSGDALKALEKEVCDDLAYVWMLGAHLPDRPSFRDVEIIRRNSASLRRAGHGYTAQRIEQEMDADPDVGRTFARVRECLPSRARETEMRRVNAVRRAVEAEGILPTQGM